MFQNNLKIAWRTLRKNKIYTLINIFGLTAGIAAALLIFRMLNYELGFNKQFKNYDRIGRVVIESQTGEGEISHTTCTPIPAMDVIENTVTPFEAMSRVKEMWANVNVPNPDGGAPLKKFRMEPTEIAFFAEPEFFQVFDFQWLAGDSKKALDEPGAIVLTQKWAEKCFDRWEDAMGKTLILDNVVSVTVKGVVANPPVDCDFTFPFLVSWHTLKAHRAYFFYDENWGSCSSNNQVYALLKDPGQWDAASLLLAKVGEKEYNRDNDIRKRQHHLQPLSDLHFSEDYPSSGSHQVAKSRLKILGGIGILILVMACFNFVNLATAQASLRAKEVGVRKTLGGLRSQLIGQFMSETGLIVAISVLLGASLASMTAPLLKHVSDVPDSLPFFSNPMVWGFLALTGILVTLLAGLYPSLALSGFQPLKAIRSNVTNEAFGGVAIRKSLVVLQFVIAQGLIVGAIITMMQLDYIRKQDLGFDKNLVYTFSLNVDSMTLARQTALVQGLQQIPTVQSVSLSSDQPFSGNTWMSNFKYASRPEDEKFPIAQKSCDANYQETYGIRLLAGKWFSPSDTMRETVVNMTLLEKLGIRDPQEAVGQTILLGQSNLLRITGVAEDFHTHSFREHHQPLLMSTYKPYYWEAGVKIRPDDINATTAAIKKVYDEVLPEQVFEGRFLDESIAEFYRDDNRLAATCKGFGLLAILISCLGLFGLATHAAAQRIKEIGIRKVLGATTEGIVALLSKDFLKLVVIALVIASPLAWYLMKEWLQDFAYRIDIQWYVFAVAGVVAVVVAFLTVSYQGIRAALANPVKSLRSE